MIPSINTLKKGENLSMKEHHIHKITELRRVLNDTEKIVLFMVDNFNVDTYATEFHAARNQMFSANLDTLSNMYTSFCNRYQYGR